MAQLESLEGYSRTAPLDDLEAEQRWRLEADSVPADDPRHVPLPEALLLPFQRLEAQLRAQTGDALVPADLPKSLQLRYPRLVSLERTGRIDTADYARVLLEARNDLTEPDSVAQTLLDRMLDLLVKEGAEVLLRRHSIRVVPPASDLKSDPADGSGE